MTYQKIYNQIIEKYKQLNLKKLKRDDKNYIYLESHHIIPRCVGGLDKEENLVNLPAREHFICHLLLTKIYKGTKFEYKLWTAMHRFIYGNDMKNKIKITSNKYKIIKENFSKFRSEVNKGEGNPNYGNRWNDEQRKNLSNQKKGKSLEELFGKEKADIIKKKMSDFQKSYSHKKGYKHTIESKLKMSLSRRGKKKPESYRKKVSERMKGNTYGKANKGRKFGEEFRKKISLAKKGKPSPNKGRRNWFKQTEETKNRISQSLKNLHRKCSEETKQKMRMVAKIIRNKKVLCIETNIIYNNYMDAAFKTKIKNIGKCCLGKEKEAGGYHWKFIP